MAGAIGINISRLFTGVFAFGAMLAALGGALGPRFGSWLGDWDGHDHPGFHHHGDWGFRKLKGAFVGALIVGTLSAYGILLFRSLSSS